MEYKEKPEGPFFVSFFVTNFNASDETCYYKINVIDFHNNIFESNIIKKNKCEQVNFGNNYIEINEETAINDLIENSIKIEVFAKNITSENNFILIGSESIRAFPFLHDQLILGKNITICYKYEEKKGDIENENVENEKKKKKKNNEKEEKKKKKKSKNNSKNELDITENFIKTDIDLNFHITLNINSLVGYFCDRNNYNIMNIKVDGVYNIPKDAENKIPKKNFLTFQFKFLDFCLNSGTLVEDEQNNKYKITWNKNVIYKYRNIKEIEYIYNFLYYDSFNINGYLLCFSENKKQKDNTTTNIVNSLCAKFEINISDVISNKVIDIKYKLQEVDTLKNEIKNIKENDDYDDFFIYNSAYILLTIQFYKPFVISSTIEAPFKINNLKNDIKMKNEKEKIKSENESISNLFNKLIIEGIEYVDNEINKLKKEDQIKIYQKSKEYFIFLNNLKENATYINLYNNVKNIMIKLTYEIINKKIYKNFNLHDNICSEIEDEEGEEEEENEINEKQENNKGNDELHKRKKNKKKKEKNIFSEENISCILANLFNFVYESSNIIINNYFEKQKNLNNISIDEIKKKNNISNLENYLQNIVKENEFLLKDKKNEYFYEAILLLIFKKIYVFSEKKHMKIKKVEDQNSNHIVNIIENYDSYEKDNDNNDIETNYFYKRKIADYELNNQKDNFTSLINGICKKNKNECNSYLFDYIENYEDIILGKIHTKKNESFIENTRDEKIISIFNLDENKQNKNLFIDIIYKYCKVLLVKNNINNAKNNKEIQKKCYQEYYLTKNNNENSYSYENFDYHNNFESYEKYINHKKIDSCILCLSTYIELTNFENLESIFILSLIYLNIHKYEESLKIVNYLINILKKKKKKKKDADNIKNKKEINMSNLHLFSAYNNNNLDISEEMCIYIKALCYFFQQDYIHYYINICILLNTNENELKKEFENNSNFFEKETHKYIGTKLNNKGNKKKEIILTKDEKKNKNSKKKNCEEKEHMKKNQDIIEENEEEQSNNEEPIFEKKKEEKEKEEEEEEEEEVNGHEKEKIKVKDTSKDQQDITILKNFEMNIDEIPLKDKFMLLFLIYCIKFNIINIVMYIYENKNKFLTNLSLKTNLFRQLIIKAFFSIKDYVNCIKLIEEKKEYLNNLDILYIYAECLYKLKDYEKCIEYFKSYLNLCKYKNILTKIYLQLSKVYISLKQYKEGKIMIKNSMQIYKSSYAYLYLSSYYLRKKEYVHSYKLLYKSNEINFFNHKLWGYLTIVFLHLNMKNQADKSLNNFIKMKTYDEEIISDLITVYKKYGYEKEVKYLLTLCKENY
ncbi:conserved Plasmodium protein, unknown function [Plasmodium relictum]|uniref:Uncharacterized protein n=1 Tax=Plasmodium relictum TaxID=85471 RepID=A0A1J1H623_PLARL|nr:conserved Plasmodium protein, unknown function [Plasmodium relictum]CRG98884.1 conserved Plasmodium protein, unknown function [Plasmodium relictum]